MTNIYSVDFELGSSQYAKITDGDQTNLDIIGDISFEFWIKFETVPTGADVQTLHAKDDGTNRSWELIQFETGGVKSIRFRTYEGALSGAETWDFTPTVDTWYHIGMQYDVSQALGSKGILYINKASQGNADSSVGDNPTSISNTSADFTIGARAGPTRYVDGKIDEFAIYSDLKDFSALDNKASKIGRANMQGWWRFENDLTDETANSNNLTGVNSPTFSTDVPFTVATTNFFALL
ncbi:MAG TPA: LamG domain-containing protein [bacterium]|nr:LamG domain-containing protein [bacterium]